MWLQWRVIFSLNRVQNLFEAETDEEKKKILQQSIIQLKSAIPHFITKIEATLASLEWITKKKKIKKKKLNNKCWSLISGTIIE